MMCDTLTLLACPVWLPHQRCTRSSCWVLKCMRDGNEVENPAKFHDDLHRVSGTGKPMSRSPAMLTVTTRGRDQRQMPQPTSVGCSINVVPPPWQGVRKDLEMGMELNLPLSTSWSVPAQQVDTVICKYPTSLSVSCSETISR